MTIGPRTINDESGAFVIAEIGNNHQGELGKAKELFVRAKQAGADAVKLQKRDNRSLFTPELFDKPYDNENSFGSTYGEHREFLEFGRSEYVELKSLAAELGLVMFATAFDLPSADFLAELNMPAYKLASGDLTNLPLLRHVASFGRPMILSTGGATLIGIRRAYDAVAPVNPQICLLQCTASYPTQPEDMNLRVLETLRREFPDVVVGLSDHSNGIVMAVAAYMLGARVVEKHFTLNHTWKGTDHPLSLEPIGLTKMVRDLGRVRVALGDGTKQPLPAERGSIVKMSKKLVAARDLPAGHRLVEGDIAMKCPGDGLPPYELERVVNATLRRPLTRDESLTWDLLDGVEGPATGNA
jgi:N-acetylneuraminate synthase/sialic acid synthase